MSSYISIITPIYNVESSLSNCLQSLLSLVYPNLEFILIDDGSTDNSGAICDNYAMRDSRIKVLHQDNKGVSAARNAGLEIATGDYIGFVDPDDWVEPDMFEVLYNSIIQYNADIVICNHFIHPDAGDVKTALSGHKGALTQENALVQLFETHRFEGFLWNKLFSASVFTSKETGKKIRFIDSVHVCEDIAFVMDCFLNSNSIFYIPEPLYHYVIHEGSAINSYGIKRESELIARQYIIDRLATVDKDLQEQARYKYVDVALGLIWMAVRTHRYDRLPVLKPEVRKYLPEYLKSSKVSVPQKVKALLLLHIPRTSLAIRNLLPRRKKQRV